MNKKIIVILTILVVTGIMYAQSFTNNLRINGFLSQAYLMSSGNDFLVSNSKDGSLELNEAGLAISSQVSPKLRIGMQILGRDFGDFGENAVNIDWAFADYRYRDHLGFRFGKVKMPFGLYNDGRDTDILRPTVFLPQSVYDEHYRPYYLAYQGAGIYGNIPMGSFLGSLDYNLYYGSQNLDRNELIVSVTNGVANSLILYAGNSIRQELIGQGLPAETASALVTITPTSYTDAKTTSLYGGTAFLTTPFGLRTGFSYLRLGLDFYSEETPLSVNLDSINPEESFYISNIRDGGIPVRYALSGEYTFGSFLFASEYSLYTLKQTFYDNKGKEFLDLERDDLGYYLMFAYSLFDDRLTASFVYDYAEIDRIDIKVEDNKIDFLATEKDTWKNERKDYGFGLRYDLDFNWSFKAEYHIVDGYAKVYSEYLNPYNNDAKDAKKSWTYGLLKVSYNF